jgi:uncharacterized membrane protein YadS
MDNTTLLLALMTACLLGVTIHAWRIGNEKRDVVLLGATAAVCGIGTAIAATV